MRFDRPVTVQKMDEETEEWVDIYRLHARINKARADNEHFDAGAERSDRQLMFEVRYFKDLEKIAYNTQMYRIIYMGIPFNIVDYDDYMLMHRTVKLVGVSYGE